MCGAHATVRGFLGELVAGTSPHHDIVVDMEAGLEHLSRGTGRHVSAFLAIVEPYHRSMETARRIAELARELGVSEVRAVINKVRDDADREAVLAFCGRHQLAVAGMIPFDPELADAERAGLPPFDASVASRAVSAIADLGRSLLAGPAR